MRQDHSARIPVASAGPRTTAVRTARTILLALLSACGAEANDVAWRVSFECDADRARAAQVQLGIAPGECPVSSRPVYETAVARDSQAPSSPPGDLPAGPYAFYANALDAGGTLVASTCESISLPRPGAVELVLVGENRCAPNRGDGGEDLPIGTAALGEACAGHANCESGECCTIDQCGGGMCSQTCAGDADCPVGSLCEHQMCFLQCKVDADCRAGWLCKHMGTICEAF